MSWERFFEVTFGVKPDTPSGSARTREAGAESLDAGRARKPTTEPSETGRAPMSTTASEKKTKST